jgi:sigma-B regulation protein RsbU (phosphoserine phosphatase)
MRHWIDARPYGGQASSGDFADCFAPAAERRAIVVGDVAGHGPDAGAAAAILRHYVRELVNRGVPLDVTLRATCELFERRLATDTMPFVSVFVALLDARLGFLRYASAGHEPGFLFDSDGRHVQLGPTGPVLGLGLHSFGQRALRLWGDSLLVVVTDGVTEARRRGDDGTLSFFGGAGVMRAVDGARRTRSDPARAVCTAAEAYAGGELSDDACAVAFSPVGEMAAVSR